MKLADLLRARGAGREAGGSGPGVAAGAGAGTGSAAGGPGGAQRPASAVPDAGLPAVPAEGPGGEAGQVQWIEVGRIRPGAVQPRRHLDPGELQELAQSIREHGVLQPLLVRAAGDGYELLAGERRGLRRFLPL